jgi:hypothetical protein
MESEQITVGGIIFNHGTNGEYEFYFHSDHNKVVWQAWRHLSGPDQTGWYASVHQPAAGGVDAVLNSLIHLRGNSAQAEDQPTNIGDAEPSVLLCGLAGLIKAGELPKYESYQARVIAPVVNTGESESTTVEFYVECVGCKQLYSLKVERADYDCLSNRTEFIQDIFPYLQPPMRELLISGNCPKCWKRMFGSEDTSAETYGHTSDIEEGRD